MNSSHENIYYLDPWFLAREYESRRNFPFPSKVRKTSGGTLGGSFFVSGSVSSQEVIEFDQSPEKAFWEICADLEDIPDVALTKSIDLPSLFWVSGILAPLGEFHKTETTGQTESTIDEVWSFAIGSYSNDSFIRLLVDNTFFRYNIQNIISHPTTLGSHFRPNVRALLKSHRGPSKRDGRFHLATPLVIIEKES